MIDLRKSLFKRILAFYKNINKNTQIFYTNLIFYNFDNDLIFSLIKIYRKILKKYEKKKKKYLYNIDENMENGSNYKDDHFVIFSYVMFSYLNFLLSELDQNHSDIFELCHDFNTKNVLVNIKKEREKKKKTFLNIKKLLWNNYFGTKLGDIITNESKNEINYDLYFMEKDTKKYISPNDNTNGNTMIKQNCVQTDNYYNIDEFDKKNMYSNINTNYYHKIDKSNNNNYIFQPTHIHQTPNCNDYHCSQNTHLKVYPLSENNDEIVLLSNISTYLKEKKMITNLKSLYTNMYYWACLSWLNIKCKRLNNRFEGNVLYIDIYKNIYNLYKHMNNMYSNHINMMIKKKEQLSITHNNEMENIINENKINKKNKNFQQTINDMVYKHIAEKKALNRHIEHELNIMKRINLKEYKRNILYIFYIIENKNSTLSLPPLPNEKGKENNNEKNNNISKKQNDIYPLQRPSKSFAHILKYFNFFYLYKLIKTKINVHSYFHLYIKNNLSDKVMDISIIFSLGEIHHLFEYSHKNSSNSVTIRNNNKLKKKFYKLLKNMHSKNYVYSYEKHVKAFTHLSNKPISEKQKGKKNLIVNNINKDKSIENTLINKNIDIKEDKKSNYNFKTTYSSSKYFDENGYFNFVKKKVQEDEIQKCKKETSTILEQKLEKNFENEKCRQKNIFNKSYCSTYKILTENSMRFLKIKPPNSTNNNMHIDKLTIKDKKLNALILYIYEDINNNKEEIIYKNLFNINLAKPDFVFPNMKEQLNLLKHFRKPRSQNVHIKNKKNNNIEKESHINEKYNQIDYITKDKTFCSSYGNIIITRHKNLRLAMHTSEKNDENKIKIKKNKGLQKISHINFNNIRKRKNDSFDSEKSTIKSGSANFINSNEISSNSIGSNYINSNGVTSNSPTSNDISSNSVNSNDNRTNEIKKINIVDSSIVLPIHEILKKGKYYSISKKNQHKNNSNINYKHEYYKNVFLNMATKKKKSIYINIIFHVVIPKNMNRKSFKIILYSLFKILDICNMYGISSINCSFPYIQNIVHKNKRPIIYSFIYSLIFTLLHYMKDSYNNSNNVKILHFIFPNLKYYEKKTHTQNISNYLITKRNSEIFSYHKNSKMLTNTMENKNEQKYTNIENELNDTNPPAQRKSNIKIFINKIIHTLREKYTVIESV
ncbi:conserved Plasmodium protein, unknown function [Plasmodium berghei]|uniref:Uncharacterized protein n=3 Tax=Plasmodium berghei TaxID=5821 RepID=A0A509AUY3_PLABA|nr:conserved Plasmodium protein, unknown function [Plasmodium berghei ANKA]CXJ23291.1 conserved Plasmodium protein, unknown function [Plasmodium berghei]SCM26719.1 conserved Plasmodium protein, unknown function [Plasmodium berghei]SCO62789.1 conserved Plasmodium protein, unknown function [Plasmodium berghei]VUC58482.1 conserved Plasmodium protein, unknown function [Plasmodium berghei ANKA]|eukprot:XP_034424245.1 conserved Plasmodium protein, unknown function [Plasmodium berghei ANKA]